MTPLAIDLFCGLGGWTEGLSAEGYRVIGFDNMQHVYGEARYPGQLVIQDVLTLHGSQFKDAALIVASPPCQAYSYRAMPWKRAKALPPPSNELFDACFRIQREASEAAGHHIPLVVENVCGAQKWVGRARWHYGSFYLWGDVPALMPITNSRRTAIKVGGFTLDDYGKPGYKAKAFNGTAEQRLKAVSGICIHGTHWSADCEECGIWRVYPDNGVKVPSESGRRTDVGTGARFTSREGSKNDGGSWFAVAHNTTSGHGQNPDGRKRNDTLDDVKVRSEVGRRTDVCNGVRFTSRDCGIERVSFGSGVPGGDTRDYCGNAGSDQQHARSIKHGGDWFGSGTDMSPMRKASHRSSARKAASAHIAKIPFELARHIARCWYP